MNVNQINYNQKSYFMKKVFLTKSNAPSICTLLLVFLFSLFPQFLKAQPNYAEEGYVSQGVFKTLIGTPDSRIMSSIHETDSSVTMQLSAVGYMKANMLSFAFFYDPNELRLCDQNFEPIEIFNDLQAHSAVLSPELTAKSWNHWGSHKDVGSSFILNNVSGHQSMRAIWYDMAYSGINPNNLFVVDSGRVQNILHCTFKKQTRGKALENDAIGIGVKTTSIGSNLYQPKFGYDGLFLWYRQTAVSNDKRIINPELFLYRSGSSVKTKDASDVGPSLATLNGTFYQGTLPASEAILDTIGTGRTGTGRLHHDIVKQYGFIYSQSDVNLSIDDFSESLIIDNVNFPVPTPAEILAQTFTRGTNGEHVFNIAMVGNNNGNLDSLHYSTLITGLLPQKTYYAWAYKHYSFETTDTYQSVGNRTVFTTDGCIALNIGTVYTVLEPVCNQPTGKIQMFVTGGSGAYAFSVNGGEFKTYTDDIIDGLMAGTYSITVSDIIQSSCPTATVDNIVLYNATTDLHIAVTPRNATSCESLTGALELSVTGGVAPYTFSLNGAIETVTNNVINNLKAGVYVVSVSDKNECVASSGEVRITSDASNLLVVINNQEDTQCNETSGTLTFTITGSTDFNYQLDGFPLGKCVSDTTIELTGLTAGEHILRVWDNCKEIIETITISNGINALAFTAIPKNELVDCFGNLIEGNIVLNVTNGDANYKYSINGSEWKNFPNNSTTCTIPDLHTGTYRVEVMDNNECKYEVNGITISRETYTPIHVGTIFAANEPSCKDDDGAIQVIATGGSGEYEYKINNGQFNSYPNGLINNLTAGTYTITIRDKNFKSCPPVIIPDVVLHNSVTNLSLSITADNATTCESLTGKLYVSVTGGEAPYRFTLNGNDQPVINGEIPNLKAGVYVVNVIDKNECEATSGVVRITSDESNLAVVITKQENTVCGSATGSVVFEVTSSDSYKYQIDGYPEKQGTTAPVVITGLGAGVHYLRVWDNCAEIIEEVVITNGENGLAFTATPVNETLSCNGSLSAGTITINVSNGTADYKYRYDGGEWKDFPTNATTFTIPNLHAGTYRVEVKDATECTYEVNRVTITREIYSPINVGTIFANVEPACGQNTGEIQIFATGGSGVYQYSLDGTHFENLADGKITGLLAGTYTITVRDAIFNLCPVVTIPDVVLHNSNSDFMVDVTPVNASDCESPTGKLLVSITGGEALYRFFLNDNETPLINGEFPNLKAGVYTVKVIDKNNCIATSGEVRIKANNVNLLVAINQQTNTECGSSTGAVNFTVTGSTNYYYQLDGYPEMTGTSATPNLITGLSAGIHILKVWDKCNERIDTINITNGTNALAFTYTVKNEVVSCNGSLTGGSIELNVTNGTPNFKYRYNDEWKNFPTGESTVTIPNLHAGTYRVEVMDETGCTYEVNQITISREVYTPIYVSTIFAETEPTCKNNDGEIYVFATGGSGEYEYSLDGNHFETLTNGLITNLYAGTYDITIRDAQNQNCPSVTKYNFKLPNSDTDLDVMMTATNAQTCTSEDGALYVTVTGGKAPYNYMLNGLPETVNNGVISPKKAGVYMLEVTDNAGCVATSREVRIAAEDSQIFVNVDHKEDTECGNSTGSITFSVNGSSDYTYQLNGYPEVNINHNNPVTITGIIAGEHYLRVWNDCAEAEEKITIYNAEDGLIFTATPVKEIVACNGDVISGSINLNVIKGTADFKYRYKDEQWVPFPTGLQSITITDLTSGVYCIEVMDATNCVYQVNNVVISHETSFGTPIMPPVATSPQMFCSGATVENLQANGIGVKWYTTAEGGNTLLSTDPLTPGAVYYAAQTLGTCESSMRTAVKVIINDQVVVETPTITSPQEFCNPADELTLAAIATNGNTNIVWYENATGGDKLPSNTKLEERTYYAALELGACQSSSRKAVEVSFTSDHPDAVEITSPQKFCEGALIANIAVPNNKIVWYANEEDQTRLPLDYLLEGGKTYYAAQVAGECESEVRTPVEIQFSTPDAPVATSVQVICEKITLADLAVTGYGIVWYDAEENGNVLPLNTTLVVGKSYWAVQTFENCESYMTKVTITDECFVVYGTMFPFVHTDDENFNSQFPVTVKLYAVPPKDGKDPFETIMNSNSLHSTNATYYDGSVHIDKTPLKPGKVGNTNNPGLKIDWESIGREVGTIDSTYVTQGQTPQTPVGMYKFENVVPGEYILEISRPGFITRWGKVTVDVSGKTLGHRELIAGDVNGDFQVDASDISINVENYNPTFDLNGDDSVNSADILIIQYNIRANIGTYVETLQWASEYE